MKIAILLPDMRGGGAERVKLDLAAEFARRGHDVEFVLMRARGELLPLATASFAVSDLQVDRVRHALRPLRRWIGTNRPDVVFAGMWPLTVLGILATLGTGSRVVVSDQNLLSMQYGDWGRVQNALLRLSIGLTYPLASARIGVSPEVARDVERLGRLRSGSVEVVRNPARPLAVPSPEALRAAESSWMPRPAKRVLHVGRLKKQKNQPLLLRAFARVAARTEAHLILLGDGPMRAELAELARRLGVADRVTFAGFVPDPAPFYETADLFVLSSEHEGFVNVVTEALAHGLPVVATDCPSGPSEILNAGEFGTLVPVGDEAALAEGMLHALANPMNPEELRRRAADFAPGGAAEQYLRLMAPRGDPAR